MAEKLQLCVIDDFDMCAQMIKDYTMSQFPDIVEGVYSFRSAKALHAFFKERGNKPRIDFFIIDFYLSNACSGDVGMTGVHVMRDLHNMPEYRKSVYAIASAEDESYVNKHVRELVGEDITYVFLSKPTIIARLNDLLSYVVQVNQLNTKK